MGQGRQKVTISVLVEPLDGSAAFYKTWTGSSASGIHKAVRAHYKDVAKVSFGNALHENFYGAH